MMASTERRNFMSYLNWFRISRAAARPSFRPNSGANVLRLLVGTLFPSLASSSRRITSYNVCYTKLLRYTTTLFNIRKRLLSQISPALEMGRSFVRPEYQRQFLPLLLLWRGIGTYVVRNPRYRNLFGSYNFV